MGAPDVERDLHSPQSHPHGWSPTELCHPLQSWFLTLPIASAAPDSMRRGSLGLLPFLSSKPSRLIVGAGRSRDNHRFPSTVRAGRSANPFHPVPSAARGPGQAAGSGAESGQKVSRVLVLLHTLFLPTHPVVCPHAPARFALEATTRQDHVKSGWKSCSDKDANSYETTVLLGPSRARRGHRKPACDRSGGGLSSFGAEALLAMSADGLPADVHANGPGSSAWARRPTARRPSAGYAAVPLRSTTTGSCGDIHPSGDGRSQAIRQRGGVANTDRPAAARGGANRRRTPDAACTPAWRRLVGRAARSGGPANAAVRQQAHPRRTFRNGRFPCPHAARHRSPGNPCTAARRCAGRSDKPGSRRHAGNPRVACARRGPAHCSAHGDSKPCRSTSDTGRDP